MWLSRCILNPVFPDSNGGGEKVDTAFHLSEVVKIRNSVINVSQVCQGCAERQISPAELLRQQFEYTQPKSRATMHNANDSRCCNVKLYVYVKFQPYVKTTTCNNQSVI